MGRGASLKKKKKLRLPAKFGFASVVFSSLRRDLTGRVSRLRQLSLASSDAFYITLTDVGELLGLGHALGTIRRCWQGLSLHDYTYHVGVNAVVCAHSFLHVFAEKRCLTDSG